MWNRHSAYATGATAAEQAHLGHIRPDRRQLDALVDLLRGLRRVGKHGLAFRAGGQPGIEITWSGFGCSVRPTPGRLLRGGRSPPGSGRSGFCP